MRSIQTNTMIFMSDRLSVAFSFSRRGALIHHLQSRRWYPSRWSGSCAPHELSFRQSSRGGQAMSQANIPCAVGSIFCTISKTMRWHIATPSRRLSAKTLPRTNPSDMFGSFYAAMGIAFPATPSFSFQKRNRKKGR